MTGTRWRKIRLLERGEKGFTLIELLIVVAILGVLAAVIIPSVGRFMDAGKTEAAKTELDIVQTAVLSMMVDNELSTLPNPVTTATDNMSAFPDDTSIAGSADKQYDLNRNAYQSGDKNGFLLYQHDRIADNSDNTSLVKYVANEQTKGTYIVNAYGTVAQVNAGY